MGGVLKWSDLEEVIHDVSKFVVVVQLRWIAYLAAKSDQTFFTINLRGVWEDGVGLD